MPTSKGVLNMQVCARKNGLFLLVTSCFFRGGGGDGKLRVYLRVVHNQAQLLISNHYQMQISYLKVDK